MWYGEDQSQGSREDNENSSTLRSESVFNGHFHIVKGDIGGAGGRRIAGLNRLGLYALTSGNQDDSEPILSLATGGKAASRASLSRPD